MARRCVSSVRRSARILAEPAQILAERASWQLSRRPTPPEIGRPAQGGGNGRAGNWTDVQRWQPSSCNTRLYDGIGSGVWHQIMIETAGLRSPPTSISHYRPDGEWDALPFLRACPPAGGPLPRPAATDDDGPLRSQGKTHSVGRQRKKGGKEARVLRRHPSNPQVLTVRVIRAARANPVAALLAFGATRPGFIP